MSDVNYIESHCELMRSNLDLIIQADRASSSWFLVGSTRFSQDDADKLVNQYIMEESLVMFRVMKALYQKPQQK
ncbi:hypothetical protein KIN20_029264 [Parelaphostrongylus tenuis]|uniref:Uncharacterized protein n=1 Tax=Parelaphostrongylus tenuis TaxID=148309 RepID=A0AAD5R260_PARTN|nr:hypothetical protein KIN20_029264 [Parelaphostrongylus tenuis]